MTGPFGGGGAKLNWQPTPIILDIIEGNDLIAEFPVAPGSASWPAGATAECRFYATADIGAAVLHTSAVEVTPEKLRLRVEYSDLAALPTKGGMVIYVSLPDTPSTADHPVAAGPFSKKKKW